MARPRSLNPRSVLLALRITPRTRFGLELLAQREGCSMSELVSRAVDERLHDPTRGLMLVAQGERKPTAVLDRVWSPYEHERVLRLAAMYPELLGENERYLWNLVAEDPK